MTSSAIQSITVLGATGSIGESTLDVIARHPDRYRVFALTAYHRMDKLEALCVKHRPDYAVTADPVQALALQQSLRQSGLQTEVLQGPQGLVDVAQATGVDTVMAAIVGAAGLLPTLAAARAGKRILLANKEALVLSGSLFMDAVRASAAVLLPIDSEHNAIFQALPACYDRNPVESGVRRVLLTASGGPFRQTPLDRLSEVTPSQACAHPNWVMGRKISVDSASMMNKGLEVIEAHWLFGLAPELIDVVIHPQSVIHSMVEYLDGSVVAQLGNPDMRTPIAHALAYPQRIESGVASLDLFKTGRLDFEPPDLVRFPCLRLAFECLRRQGGASAVLNAANEEAVAAFLDERIKFTEIPVIIEETLERIGTVEVDTIEAVLEADTRSRDLAQVEISKRQRS